MEEIKYYRLGQVWHAEYKGTFGSGATKEEAAMAAQRNHEVLREELEQQIAEEARENAAMNNPAVVFLGFYPGFYVSTLHKSVNSFRPCLFPGRFSFFLVEEDAQKAHSFHCFCALSVCLVKLLSLIVANKFRSFHLSRNG
jgi:hypothetical protein